MADATTVIEGKIKFREGKKWKPRWCIFKKPSPVADQLQVVLYKDFQAVKEEAKPKNVFVLEAYFGLDANIAFDKEAHVLAIICQKCISLMAFEHRELLIQFEIKIRESLGEEHQFPVVVVKAPSNSRLVKDQVKLVIHDVRFCLIAHMPPKICLSWNIEDLRRFGATENKFCFEGGSRCGKGTGVFALQSEQAKDIEDIVQLAATGKMSNGHRKFKNRSSQVDLSSHLIADMLPSHSSTFINHNQHCGSRSPAPLPVTLNCCHDSQTNSAESEDWSWYKRHSVSVMDHHRIAALRDNRDPFMGIYDVPPNHGRTLSEQANNGMSEESNYAVPRSHPETDNRFPSNYDYNNYKQIVFVDKKNPSIDEHIENKNSEVFDFKEENVTSVSPSASTSREESLQRLKKQESDLQREMILLDEILQNCGARTYEKSSAGVYKDNVSSDHQSTLTMPLMADELVIISGNISPFRAKAETLRHFDRAVADKLNTSMPEKLSASPLNARKMKNICAPLPYVNLSRYDDESYSHVHFPGSADSIPLVKHSNEVGFNQQMKLGGQSNSLINLNSLTVNVSHSPSQQKVNKCHYSKSQNDQQEILVVKLDDSLPSDPVVYTSVQCMIPDKDTQMKNSSSDLIKVLTSDVSHIKPEENYVNCEAIYENLPAKAHDVPPKLPPKGPALLQRLNEAAYKRQFTNYPNMYRVHLPLYDGISLQPATENMDLCCNNPKKSLFVDGQAEKTMTDAKENNYCIMGSPKIRHKDSPATKSQLKSSMLNPRNDYMDMGVHGSGAGEDDIYLDVDKAKSLEVKDLYISEADLKTTAVVGESAYMDMSCLSTRKSIVVPNSDSSLNNAGKASIRDVAKQNQRSKLGPAPPPPCPPRPSSLKTRQVVDDIQSNSSGDPNTFQEKHNQIKPQKSSMKIYTKAKKPNHTCQSPSEPLMPFPNLIEFTKKMSESRSTYVNTFIDSEKVCAANELCLAGKEVLLPEPAKEGFLARFKRRSSKDKNASQNQEKSSKNRNSILERSMSEHETSKVAKDEKTTKLKLGRRRSSSFPNRLSYQESHDGVSMTGISQVVVSCASCEINTCKPTNHQTEHSESSSSIHDFSDDSDLSPLLKRGEKKINSLPITVLHVHQSVNNPQYPYMHLSKISPQGRSSKTDDEKLIEMIQLKNNITKPVIYQRSSSLELTSPTKSFDQPVYSKVIEPSLQNDRRFSFEKSTSGTNLTHSSSIIKEQTENVDHAAYHENTSKRNVFLSEEQPPSLPPKQKPYQQVPLSPVLESFPFIHAAREPLYVELDDVEASEKGDEKKDKGKDKKEIR